MTLPSHVRTERMIVRKPRRQGVYQTLLRRILSLQPGEVVALDLNPDTENERTKWANGVRMHANKIGVEICTSRPRPGVLHMWATQ